MIKIDRNELWNLLLQGDVVAGELPERQAGSPWYITVLLAFSGWLASLFVLLFFGAALSALLEIHWLSAMIGIWMLVPSYVLPRLDSKTVFLESGSLAIGLAGQALFYYSIAFYFGNFDIGTGFWFLILITQFVILVTIPYFLHQMFASLGFSAGIFLFLGSLSMEAFVPGILMLCFSFCMIYEFRFGKYSDRMRSGTYGLVIAAIVGLNMHWFNVWNLSEWKWWIVTGRGFTGLVSFAILAHIAYHYTRDIKNRVFQISLLAALLMIIITWNLQGVLLGSVLLALGYFRANLLIWGLGILSLLWSVSFYYYLWEVTLLEKSIYLFVVGVGLLSMKWILSSLPVFSQEKGNA